MPDDTPTATVMGEIGKSGLKTQSGLIHEDYLTVLQGRRGIEVYTQMRDDPIVAGSLMAIEMQLRSASWSIKPFSTAPEDVGRAERLDTARNDMSQSWAEWVSEAISFLQFGWAYHEVCYKFCNGPQKMILARTPDGQIAERPAASKFNDGLCMWRKLPIRAQDTLHHWELDPAGGIQGMWQEVTAGRPVFVPIDKSLLLRTTSRKNSPEGRSLLRSAYRPWYYKWRIEEYRAVGIERDLVGIPKFGVPASILDPNATGLNLAIREGFQQIGENIRNNEQAYLMYPLAYDANGHPQYEIDLMGSPGKKLIDVAPVIQQYSREIAQSILTDVLMMGHEKVGTQSLAETKDDILNLALQSWADSIAEAFNRHVIPKVLQLNGWPLDRPPYLCAGKIGRVTLQELGNLIEQLSRAGFPLFPDGQIERWIADQAGMPYDEESRARAQETMSEVDDEIDPEDEVEDEPDDT